MQGDQLVERGLRGAALGIELDRRPEVGRGSPRIGGEHAQVVVQLGPITARARTRQQGGVVGARGVWVAGSRASQSQLFAQVERLQAGQIWGRRGLLEETDGIGGATEVLQAGRLRRLGLGGQYAGRGSTEAIEVGERLGTAAQAGQGPARQERSGYRARLGVGGRLERRQSVRGPASAEQRLAKAQVRLGGQTRIGTRRRGAEDIGRGLIVAIALQRRAARERRVGQPYGNWWRQGGVGRDVACQAGDFDPGGSGLGLDADWR